LAERKGDVKAFIQRAGSSPALGTLFCANPFVLNQLPQPEQTRQNRPKQAEVRQIWSIFACLYPWMVPEPD